MTSREVEVLKKLIYHEERENIDKKYRFDEITYSFVWKAEIIFGILQFVTAIFWVGNWFSFVCINIPRMLWDTMTFKKFYPRWVHTREGTVRYYKAERIFRIITLCMALVLEIGCATFLAEQFCYFWGVDEETISHRVSQTVACKWQIFGFRMVFVVVMFPIDFIMMLVVLRHCKDVNFNFKLGEKVRTTIRIED